MEWVSILTALLVLFALYLWSKTFKPKNFPPGPQGIPFLGNILSLGKQPHLSILKWKEKYGDTYSIYLGKNPMVILSNFNTVRKIFGDDLAAGRPDRSESVIRGHDSKVLRPETGLLLSEGDVWKTHRRFALSTLRDLGMGKNWLEDTIITEVEGLCKILTNTNRKPFNPKVHLTNSVSNVICALIFGQRFSLTDPKFSRLTSLIAENLESSSADTLAQALPFLLWFPNTIRSRVLRGRRNLVSLAAFLKERVDEHAAVADRRTDVRDYLDAYQDEMESGSKTAVKEKFDEEQLLTSLFDLFTAGTETTSTTTLWSLVFMIENPDVMRKVQQEIDNNVGREKMLTNSDRGLLPYTEAVILEVQRCASLTPLGVPHRSREKISVDGYIIPKNTIIVANFFSIHRDVRWWKNPEKFDPCRFLDENMKLTRPEGFAPFSIGKRACLGEALAKMELFLFIGNLLRCFTLELPPAKTISHKDCTANIVNCPVPFELIFNPRT